MHPFHDCVFLILWLDLRLRACFNTLSCISCLSWLFHPVNFSTTKGAKKNVPEVTVPLDPPERSLATSLYKSLTTPRKNAIRKSRLASSTFSANLFTA